MFEFENLGVIFDEGRKCSMKGFAGISGLEKITKEEFEKIMNDFDPIEAPPGPYKLQPNKKGKKSIFYSIIGNHLKKARSFGSVVPQEWESQHLLNSWPEIMALSTTRQIALEL